MRPIKKPSTKPPRGPITWYCILMIRKSDPHLVMLCGIPTSGKSSYYLDSIECFDDYIVLSTDIYIDNYAAELGKTYDEVFPEAITKATANLEQEMRRAFRSERNVLWDQTNLTLKARKWKLSKVPSFYYTEAIWFDISLEDAMIRNQERPGKIIPPNVLKSMHESFVRPTIEEGFNFVRRGY